MSFTPWESESLEWIHAARQSHAEEEGPLPTLDLSSAAAEVARRLNLRREAPLAGAVLPSAVPPARPRE